MKQNKIKHKYNIIKQNLHAINKNKEKEQRASSAITEFGIDFFILKVGREGGASRSTRRHIYLFTYLFIYLLKVYSPVNRKRSPQMLFTEINQTEKK